MRLGTTPSHTFTFPFETSMIEELKITYSQNRKIVLEKYLDDCTIGTNSVTLSLTQSETFLFDEKVNVEVQARVVTTSRDVLASDIHVVIAGRCLDREVL